MIENFLGVKNSTRNLSDDEFEELLPILAEELSKISFYHQYTDKELLDDWMKLVHWIPNSTSIASTQRLGMKLCEQFFPNFFDIQNKKGDSLKSLWTPETLQKVLRWNRTSHTTPYLSELKRGVYFNFNLPKSTMYRPQMAKMVVSNLGGKRVLDPCAGWGGRMLGSVSAGLEYVAFEPNTETYLGLVKMINYLEVGDKATIINDSALNMPKYHLGLFDIILTSPPYFDLEIYSNENSQSITGFNTYSEWLSGFLTPLIQLSLQHLSKDGWSCWNVHNVGKMKMIDDIERIHKTFPTVKRFSVDSSKRQTNQNKNGDRKNLDFTICYSSREQEKVNKFF